MKDDRLRVVLGWHMHQPEYRDPASGEFRLPWTCLHAIKDYADMAAHLEDELAARAVVNFAPLLLEQLEDYAARLPAHLEHGQPLRDASLAALVAGSYPRDAGSRRRIVDGALRAHPERLIGHYPAYRALAERAAAHELDDAGIADLVTWFHLAWLGETVRRRSPEVQALLAQERGYRLEQRRALLRLIGELVAGIVPRYRALAAAGRIELSVTPYGHPILPLLLDFAAAHESLPQAPLPAEPGYPGGEARAQWHLRRALEVFERHFGFRPQGCWCAEGGVSEAALQLVAEAGFRWTAAGQTVLGSSAGSGVVWDRPYRVLQLPLHCFFRDDELSDRIGFHYSRWHGDDAVEDFIRALEQRAAQAAPGSVVTVFLDGENAWEHYPANGYYFLGALYRRLAQHPRLRLSTFAEALAEGLPEGRLDHVVAGSWVYGSFSTWIGSADKNRGWSLLIEAKQAFDRAAGGLDVARFEAARRQLGVCESSDWFWWLGDDNPERAVSDFEQLFRLQLTRLYELLDEPVPARLREVISRGRGDPALGGVMKPAGRERVATAAALTLFEQRRAGVLLHLSSLPNDLGSGDLSHSAYRFVEFAAAAGFGLWQMLPLGPTLAERSPYLSPSAFAGNPLLLSLDWLADRGWLDSHARQLPRAEGEAHRRLCLRRAHQNFTARADDEWRQRFAAYRQAESAWLADYCLFAALQDSLGGLAWNDWPAGLRAREPAALAGAQARLAPAIERCAFEQFVFDQQWAELRAYAHRHGLLLFGDLPLFVAHNSADVWARRGLFMLDASGRPEQVAGVPPDYYSATGQVWGNPLYRWEAHEQERFGWWHQRLRRQLALFDLVRLDHFRGLEACWALPAGAADARAGRWTPVPGAALLRSLQDEWQPLPLVAEDLGEITEPVQRLRERFRLAGMRVLQFGFDGSPHNTHLPHNYRRHAVAYTGTHDNPTTRQWFEALDGHSRELVMRYCGHADAPMPWPAIHAVLGSVARLAVLPLQDLLGLGAEGRMNTPGTSTGNWNWQFRWEELPPDLAARLRELNTRYARC